MSKTELPSRAACLLILILAGCSPTKTVDYSEARRIDADEFPTEAELGTAPVNHEQVIREFYRNQWTQADKKTLRVAAGPGLHTCSMHEHFPGQTRGWRVRAEMDGKYDDGTPFVYKRWFWFHGEELKRSGREEFLCDKVYRQQRR